MLERVARDLCSWYGHEWDWGTEPCDCGEPHTFRVCARCLYSDESDCDSTRQEHDGERGSAVAA